jgi:hypothetical protein
MKDAVITVRVPRGMRARLKELARREGRSLSQQVERFITAGLAMDSTPASSSERLRASGPLAGALGGARVPTLRDFRMVRALVSRALRARAAAALPASTRRGHRHR